MRGEPISEFVEGMKVAVKGLGREGELLSAPDGHGRARVRVRGRTLEVDAGDLREAAGDSERDDGREDPAAV